MALKSPPPIVVAALVEARRGNGGLSTYGPHGRGAWQAIRLGLMEDIRGMAELNLRGQDVADEAIALAGKARARP